jgi:hypothetical protein
MMRLISKADAVDVKFKATPIALLLATFALFFGSAHLLDAQEFEPRTYSVTPPGLNFVALAYGFANGAVFMDPSLPVDDVDADIHLVVARYVRTLELFGLPSKVKVMLPWSSGHWEGFVEDEFRVRDATGLGDARLVLEMQFAGAEPSEVPVPVADRGGTVWGARLQLITPTGDYDNTKLINLGANRWGMIPEIGFGHSIGKWSLEGALGAWLFGDNKDFYNGHRLEQDPLLVAKFHAIRSIRPGFWWALSAGYGYGGRTAVDGVPRATVQRNWRLAFMLAYPIRPNQGLVLSIGSGGNFGAGTDFDTVSLGYQYSWGGP